MALNFFVHDVNDGEQSFSMRLRNRRETFFISRKTAAADLKVLEKYIIAMEEDVADLLPANVYTINMLKRYAMYLKEDPDAIIALFKKSRQISVIPDASAANVGRHTIQNRSRFFQYGASTVFALAVFGYLISKMIIITNPPSITMYEPTDRTIVNSPLLVVRGKTEPTAQLKINGQTISTDADGKFQEELVLGTGLNVITVTATKRYSRERVVTREITVSNGKNVSLNVK